MTPSRLGAWSSKSNKHEIHWLGEERGAQEMGNQLTSTQSCSEGVCGGIIPQPPKLAIVHLSSGGSEEISGHSEKYGHSEQFSGYSEHSAEKTL